jgi:hypothetical protein
MMMMEMMMMITIAVVALALHPTTAIIHGQPAAFVVMPSRAKIVATSTKKSKVRWILASPPTTPPTTTTSISMGYQLPPSRDPKGPFDNFQLSPILVNGILLVLFFASPLGGIFFAITNSLFALAILTPFILFGGFQVWSALFTIEAPCPSCGVLPVRVLKKGNEPSICLNCGAYSRANANGDGLELCNNPADMMGGNGLGGASSLFDALFGSPDYEQDSMMTGGFDVIDNQTTEVFTSRSSNTKKTTKRSANIIDVDVESD